MKSFLLIYIFLFTFELICSETENGVVIEISTGKIRGRVGETISQKQEYVSFQGIPYAKPPVDDLRFLPPVKAENWDDVLDAQGDKNICTQLSGNIGDILFTIEEDCLYINVYTPSLNKTNLPVMVWIYGGAFTSGDSRYKNFAPDFFLENEVIFVSFNYRIGIFGFYSTQDEIAPGNAGLKDQILALQWVQENIAKFGGNPENVTIFGESAGAASVSYLMQTPLTKGLFQRAIMESGSTLNSWALSRNKRQAMFNTGLSLGINTTDSATLLKEMQKKFNVAILLASLTNDYGTMAFTNPLHGLLFSPCIEPDVEGAVVTEKSYALLESGRFNQVPSIIGHNSLEAMVASYLEAPLKLYMLKYTADKGKYAPAGMNLFNVGVEKEVGQQIEDQYKLNFPLFADIQNIVDFISHDQFVRPITKLAELQSEFAPVYFYTFSYIGDNYNPPLHGVGHGYEMEYLFANHQQLSEKDEVTRTRMVRMWTNFAKTGNPTPYEDDVLQNIIWPQFNNNTRSYLNISDNLLVESNPATEVVQFWDNLFRTYGNPPFDTY